MIDELNMLMLDEFLEFNSSQNFIELTQYNENVSALLQNMIIIKKENILLKKRIKFLNSLIKFSETEKNLNQYVKEEFLNSVINDEKYIYDQLNVDRTFNDINLLYPLDEKNHKYKIRKKNKNKKGKREDSLERSYRSIDLSINKSSLIKKNSETKGLTKIKTNLKNESITKFNI